jgi:hypothetical protein
MKKYILLLIFCSSCFAQKSISIQSQRKRAIFTQIVDPVASLVNNQAKESELFSAYLLPLSQKANIQQALDTYGSIRLEKGNYQGVPITMTNNQKIYGHPSTNNITSITIAAGSTNVHIESLKPAQDSRLYIYFQAGSPTTNCTLKNLRYAEITGTNVMLSNNLLIDVLGVIRFDCSTSGYIRNNKIIRQTSGRDRILVMKGNDTTPSYGNVNFHTNFLGSVGQTTDIDNLDNVTLIGTDAETYAGLTKEILYVNNVDKLKSLILIGGINYASGQGFSSYDATEAYVIQDGGGSDTPSTITPRTNFLNFNTRPDKVINRTVGTVTGYNAKSYTTQIDRDVFPKFDFNGVEQTATITDQITKDKLTNSILGTQYTPWVRPTFETIPDPLGANWRTDRIGKLDSTAYIQNLINTNGVADLPEGVFYISSTLNLETGVGDGIIGKGTGKTVICGLTDDFPLISVTSGASGNIELSYLTLQGGSVGLYISNHTVLISFQALKFVSFRDQVSGIEIFDIFGLDNCFFEYLSFINCNKGIYSHPFTGVIDPNNIVGSTYIDKTVFYKSQFINCNTAMDLKAARASNLNAWVDCKFDGGLMAVDISGEYIIFANCDFTNYTGDHLMKASTLNLLNCNFFNNSNIKSTLASIVNTIEGCNFLDNIPLGYPNISNSINNYVFNSTITGNAIVLGNGISARTNSATFINSTLLSNPTISKLLVKLSNNTPTVLIDAVPNPYPQFLVTQ